MTFSPLTYVPCRQGDKGEHVARMQGWLALHGYDPGPCDGDFGPQTDNAFFRWRLEERGWLHEHNKLPLTETEWAHLAAPLARAMAPLQRKNPVIGETLGDAVAYAARQWLAQQVGGGPLRELPGNSGPVVEALVRGVDGYDGDYRVPWCAAWVRRVLRQACESLGADMPIRGSLSCDELARQAQKADACHLISGDSPHAQEVNPGDLFLVRGDKAGDWTHCGVVLEVLPPGTITGWPSTFGPPTLAHHGGIRTAEGNTNADGSRNGTELRERVRPLSGLDFICWRTT